MFEVAEIGHKLSKKEFNQLEAELHTRLLDQQFKLKGARHSVIILLSGVDGSGKGDVVNRLNQWLDSRGIETNAFWDETDEQSMRPEFWRFWRALPPRGDISIVRQDCLCYLMERYQLEWGEKSIDDSKDSWSA